ncbi:hypothetical protein F9Z43_13025 [Pseudomonas monteilii]|uniref:Uncharacterized protein n=1 Tax=Pseudomonas monteilii TaxID=76759 RepID=A0A6G6USL0_9PSED|nr:hypothetical protein [Pseudomonas monteilii]QIG16366.1 hypothetical protein FY041_00690 [Pseudomonas monteilii]QIG21626.1 hypothetical protein FY043_00690 [Pseudomonas monteilii]
MGAGVPAKNPARSMAWASPRFAGTPAPTGFFTRPRSNSGQKKPRTSYGEGEVRGPSPDR